MRFKNIVIVLVVLLIGAFVPAYTEQGFTQTKLLPVPKNQLEKNKLEPITDFQSEVRELKQFFPEDMKIEFVWYIVNSDDLISGRLPELEGVVVHIVAWDIYWTEISDRSARIHGRKFAVIVGNVYDQKYSRIKDHIKEVFFRKAFYKMIESQEDYDLKHKSVMDYIFPY